MEIVLKLNLMQTFGLSVLVLLFGKFMVSRIEFLSKFCIPAPVVGGLVFSLLTLAGHETGVLNLTMDMTLKGFFMVCFFTTVGFGASMSILKKGGPAIFLFLAVASVLCVLQDVVGVGVAKLMGESPLLGLAAGSIPMTGGHGTSGAFGPLLEEAGLVGGTTIAIAAATFGLVSGSLIGGPTAKYIIEKYKIHGPGHDRPTSETAEELLGAKSTLLNNDHMATGFFQIAVAAGIGSVVSIGIKKMGVTLPDYVGAMLVASLLRNVFCKDGTKTEIRLHEIHSLGEIFLGVFLAMALMDMRLWELYDLAIPLMTILGAQVAMVFFFAVYVTYRFSGKDYDAAVLAAGHCGFGLGATPNGVANMTAVVQKYGPSPKAFFVLPIVGGLFIDVVNTMIITLFLNFFLPPIPGYNS
ncbi:sodium/glutamate symporter [Betaproteobacteria bacterium]|nr:sodium/glutamate symporter [Betaproteobacteria bacterium]